jgi:hypothetical protein
VGFEPTTCGSEDPKCNNKEISHRSSQDRSLPNNNNNNNNSPQIMGLKPLVLFHDWLQSQGKTKTKPSKKLSTMELLVAMMFSMISGKSNSQGVILIT